MGEISGGSDEKVDVSTDDKISAYESLLMDCKEAIEVNSCSFQPIKMIEDDSHTSRMAEKIFEKLSIYLLGAKERFD